MPPAKKRRTAAARAAAQNETTKDDAKEESAAAASKPMMEDSGNDNAQSQSQSQSALTTKLLEQHRETLKTLQQNIAELATNADDNTNSDTPANIDPTLLISSSLALSTLKSLQRRISLQVESHSAASAARRETVEECSLVLENLNYERDYLRNKIASLNSWRAEELEVLAWKELGIDPGTGIAGGGGGGGVEKVEDEEGREEEEEDVDMEDAQTGKSKITTAEEAIDAYLLGDTTTNTTAATSHRDPTNHTAITQKLHSDLQKRSSLVNQLSESKLQLKALQKKRNDLRAFLQQIPNKVKELERAGEGLNRFFYGNNDNGGGGGVWKDVLTADDDTDGGDTTDKKVQAANLLVNRPSSDRAKRFQLAKSNLPSPLYVLYVQLVGYMDAWASLEKLGGANNKSATGGNDNATEAGKKRKKSNNVLDGFVGAGGMDVSVVPPEDGVGDDNLSSSSSDWSVVLTLSPSEILPSEASSILGKTYSARSSSSASATIEIVFSFDENQGVVMARVNDEQQSNNKGDLDYGLLDNLFPGDEGSTNPNMSLSLLKGDGDGDGNDDSSDEGEDHDGKDMDCDKIAENGTNGKPYYWCQVLSGLDFPPPPSSSKNDLHEARENNDDNNNSNKEDASSFRVQTCTKAVFRQLLRRIRARKTLAAALDFLGKQHSRIQPLPIHPAMRGDDNAAAPPQLKAKLSSWVEDTSQEGMQNLSQKRYVATIKRKSTTLKATATIDTTNYPAAPPVWTLQNEDGSSGSISSWGEDHGSVSSLRQNSTNNNNSNANDGNVPPLFDAALYRIECHVNQDLDKFVRDDVETTYDWILIHQLADIVSCWDEVMSSGEGGGGSGRGKGGDDTLGGGHGRLRKGKDRRLMGFGERSPFWWYRRGL